MGDDINNEVEWHNDTILRMCGDNKLDWEAREKLNSHFPGSETQQAQYHFILTLHATCCTLTWIFQKIGVYRFYFICRGSNTVLKLDVKLLWNLFNSVHTLRDAFQKKTPYGGTLSQPHITPSPPSKVGTKIEGTFFRF